MKNILQIAIILTLCACSNQNSLTLELSNAEGLSTSSPVYANGLAVGKVNSLKVSSNQTILATIKLTGELQKVPVDSKISMNNDGLLGEKAINLNLGTSSEYFTSSDTIQLSNSVNKATSEADPLTQVIQDGVNMLTSRDKLDSILLELRRLNENLEEHMKEHNNH